MTRTVTMYSYEHYRKDLGRWIEWRPEDQQWTTMELVQGTAQWSRHPTRIIRIDHVVTIQDEGNDNGR
jgi:hypothetical protein